MKRKDQRVNDRRRVSAIFALLLFVSYLVYVPIHLATEEHCSFPLGLTQGAVHDGHHHHRGHHHHHHHDPVESDTDCPSDHRHHSADDHELEFTGKDDSAKLLIEAVYIPFDSYLLRPPFFTAGLTGLRAEIRGCHSDHPIPARAPPLV